SAIVGLVNEAVAKGGDQSGKAGRIDAVSNESDAAMRVPLPGEAATAATERQVTKRTAISNTLPSATQTGQPTGESAKSESTKTESAKRGPSGAANYFPNLVLLTQDNQPVHFYDDLLKGKIVVINFIFTTCTGICPPMTANLARVQAYLGDHVGREVNFISISVDPATDTPAEMK